MKSETLQNLFMYALAALCAFFLSKANSCQRPAPPMTAYVMKYDTLRQYIQVEGPTVIKTRVKIERDTVFDTLIIHEPSEESRVTYEATHPMQPMDGVDSLLLYEGEQQGAEGKCAFRYTIAVAHDSLQFVNIEAECHPEVKYVTVEVPALPQFSPAPLAPRPWRVGPKVAWSPQDGHAMYGAQVVWRTLYGSANFVPTSSGIMLEAGFLWPIGKKKTNTTPVYGLR